MPVPTVSGEFRVVGTPELRFLPTGQAMCKVRLVASDRRKNDAGEWEDSDTFWVTGTCWGDLAEHVAESIDDRDLVVVHGKIRTDEWTTEGGEKRTAPSLRLFAIGPSVKFRVIPHSAGRTERSSAPAREDPWTSEQRPPAPAPPPQDNEPPF